MTDSNPSAGPAMPESADLPSQVKAKRRGGARINAGRKSAYAEPTTTMRVPASKKQLIQALLQNRLPAPAQITCNSAMDNTLAFPPPQAGLATDLSNALLLKPIGISTHYQIPRAQELIPAGFPSPAEDHIEDVLDLNEHLIRNKSATFVGCVGSLSMLNAGFDVGDEILIDRSIEARHKDIVIAMIDNKFTMKRLMLCEYDHEEQCNQPALAGKPLTSRGQNRHSPIWFKAENPEFADIYPQEGQTIVIIGVVTYNIKKVINR